MKLILKNTTDFLENKLKVVIEEDHDQQNIESMFTMFEGALLAHRFQRKSIENYYINMAQELAPILDKQDDELDEQPAGNKSDSAKEFLTDWNDGYTYGIETAINITKKRVTDYDKQLDSDYSVSNKQKISHKLQEAKKILIKIMEQKLNE